MKPTRRPPNRYYSHGTRPDGVLFTLSLKGGLLILAAAILLWLYGSR